MSETVRVNLGPVINAVDRMATGLSNEIGAVRAHVDAVGTQVVGLEGHLARVEAQLNAFIATSQLARELQLAETRIVKVRQELKTTFGHHAEVRRRATGMLQAMDTNLVSNEVLRDTTEDVMVRTPGYWLAPALVAIAAWARDDRKIADRALNEAMRRDMTKSSLFFAMLMRRAGRSAATSAWMQRYVLSADPRELDREFVVVLDAVANGVFGPGTRQETGETVAQWVGELTTDAQSTDQQVTRWVDAIQTIASPVDLDCYPQLQANVTNAVDVQKALSRGTVHREFTAYLRGIMHGEITVPPKLEAQVDEILKRLVTHFDTPELPLRREERLLQTIIDLNGDRAAAEDRFEVEAEEMVEHVDFLTLITGAALHPESTAASLATRRYAIAVCKPWMIEAYEKVVAESRAAVPATLALEIDGWKSETRDASDETELVESLTADYARRARLAREQTGLGSGAKVAMVAAGIGLVLGLSSPVFFILTVLAGGYAGMEYRGLDAKRDRMEADVRDRGEKAVEVLRATLAEVVDVRAELDELDGDVEPCRSEIAAINVEQRALNRPSGARAVIS